MSSVDYSAIILLNKDKLIQFFAVAHGMVLAELGTVFDRIAAGSF